MQVRRGLGKDESLHQSVELGEVGMRAALELWSLSSVFEVGSCHPPLLDQHNDGSVTEAEETPGRARNRI
jgi:hypothetical protein